MSKMCPIIEDILEVDLTQNNIFVPMECKVFQRNPMASETSTVPVYDLREIEEYSDAFVTKVSQYYPRNRQELERNKLMVMSGPGGQGKTTQLLSLALDWSRGTNSILSGFNLLFYVPLHAGMSYHTMEDLLCESAGLVASSEKHKLGEILRYYSAGDGIAFLIDDFQCNYNHTVLTSLVNGELFPNSTVLLSGRPYWMKQFHCKRHVDVIVDMVGLSDTNIKVLFRNLLNQGEETVENLLDICKQYMFDMSLLKIPIFATLCCYIFQAHHAQNLVVCQHTLPTTTTELFNTMLRLFLQKFAVKTGKQFPVSFNRSPFLDPDCDIPDDMKRLLYQIGKMSFTGIKEERYKFSKSYMKRFFIDAEEICQLGIIACTSSNEHIPKDFDNNCVFEFYNKLFQEYMAGLYLSADPSAWMEIKIGFINAECENSENGSNKNNEDDDDGYQSYESVEMPQRRKNKPKIKNWFKFKLKSKRTECSIQKTRSFASLESIDSRHCASENVCEQTSFLNQDETQSKEVYKRSITVESENNFHQDETALKQIHPSENAAVNNDETRMKGAYSNHSTNTPFQKQPRNIVRKGLYNLLSPFQNAVVFACGSSPTFAKKMLTDTCPYALRKVCKWNSNKFDVGYESVLYCETQEKEMIHYFFKFISQIPGKAPSVIQFPTPYDEVATVHFAHDLSGTQAHTLLLKWYGLDLNADYLHGANIVKSDTDFIELSDPCLFEMLLMHKFKHVTIKKIKAHGNYFPGFRKISASFPNLNELIFDGVNIPSMPQSGYIHEFEHSSEAFFQDLHHIQLLNVHSSHPLCPELGEVLQACSHRLQTLRLERFHCELPVLFFHLSCMSNLQRLMVAKMGMVFENIVGKEEKSSHDLTLCYALQKLSNLQTLDLTGNTVGISLPGIMHSLHTNSLTELVLGTCKLLNFANDKFFRFQHLEHVDLSGNAVSDNLRYVISTLTKCSSLHSLILRRCSLNSSHFKEAAVYFSKLTSLQNLDVSENILECATEELLNNLPVSLEELNVRNCDIQSDHAVRSAKGLKTLTGLLCLNVQDNPIHGGIEPLIKALKKNKVIKLLYVQNCKIRPKNFQQILPHLAAMPQLEELGIGKNTCCDESADARNAFVKYMIQCRCLEKLHCCVFHGKPLQQSHVDQLKQHIQNVVVFRVDH